MWKHHRRNGHGHSQADKEAVRQTERILRAFVEGDTEVINAEIARRNGKFLALLAELFSKPLIDDEQTSM